MTRRTPTRQRLLDAAADAVVSGGWARTRMSDVAAAAGVSRQTLYYEFGSKDRLAEALALREADRYADGAEAATDGTASSPAETVRGVVEYTLREAADNPLLKAVLTDSRDGGAGELLPYLTTRAEALHAAAAERCADRLLSSWPHLPPADVALAADVVTRLTVSHLVLPGGRPEQVADDVARLVDRLLPAAPPARPTPGGAP
ncbi:MAG TPA: TetR family transcriptional regulator [Mycobacteriales bacterium]|nr:TetR family transcriptional regulator [Mycobacteriales bacterium]